jgi:hypothetical protein
MNRWRVGKDRASKEMDRCPLTLGSIMARSELDDDIFRFLGASGED